MTQTMVSAGRRIGSIRSPHRNSKTAPKPYIAGKNMVSYLTDTFVNPYYSLLERDKLSENRKSHLMDVARSAAKLVVRDEGGIWQENALIVYCLGLIHDLFEDTGELGQRDFPVVMAFEDPSYSHKQREGWDSNRNRLIAPRCSGVETYHSEETGEVMSQNVYYLDGLLHDAGPLGRALVLGAERLTRLPEDENYQKSIERLLDFPGNLISDGVYILAAIAKLADWMANSKSAWVKEPVKIVRDYYDFTRPFGYCDIFLSRLSEIEKVHEPDSKEAGDIIYHMKDLRVAIKRLREQHEANNNKVLNAAPGKYPEVLEAAIASSGNARKNTPMSLKLKTELQDIRVDYAYVRESARLYLTRHPFSIR